MELKDNKIEFDVAELMPLLIGDNKQEGFKYIGEKILNSLLEKEFEAIFSPVSTGNRSGFVSLLVEIIPFYRFQRRAFKIPCQPQLVT